jgi:hypothetical protein
VAPDDIGEYMVRVYAVSDVNSYGQSEASVKTRMAEGKPRMLCLDSLCQALAF